MVRKIIGIILTVLASFCIIFGVLFSATWLIPALAGDWVQESGYDASTNGIVIEAHKEPFEQNDSYTIVYYEVDGESYTYETNKYLVAYPVGTEVTVQYETDDPADSFVKEIEDAATEGVEISMMVFGIFFLVLFVGVGIVMLIIGIILLIWAKKKPDLSKKVSENKNMS